MIMVLGAIVAWAGAMGTYWCFKTTLTAMQRLFAPQPLLPFIGCYLCPPIAFFGLMIISAGASEFPPSHGAIMVGVAVAVVGVIVLAIYAEVKGRRDDRS